MFQFVVFILMCLLYIIQSIYSVEFIDIMFILISILAFQQAFSKLDKRNRIFTGFLFLTGIIINFIYGYRGLGLFDGITQNLPLLAIILLAPLISLPLRGEGVITTVIHKMSEYRDDDRKIFNGVTSFMTMLAPILNMGAIRIIHGFIEDLKFDNKLLSHAYYGGFTPAVVWSPFFASVGVVISMAEMSYISYMPVGIVFAAIQFTIAMLIMRPSKKVSESCSEIGDNTAKKDYILLSLFILLLISLLIILEVITGLPILLLVSINCIVIPALWTLIRNKKRWMAKQINEFKNQMVSKTNMEAALFLSAGLFGSALMNTPIATVLKRAITWSAQGTVLLVFIFVIVFITLMAFLGIHQIISTPIVFPLLLTPEIDVTLHTAAFMCIYTWMFSSSISPLNALNIIISNCIHVNGIKVAFNWNGRFFITSFVIACIYVVILNQF